MTTQAARVALWVPTTSPDEGDHIVTTDAPAGAQAPIATEFAAPAVTTTTRKKE